MSLSSKQLKSVAKVIIAILVVAGLVWAGVKALDQWRQLTLELNERLIELQMQIDATNDRAKVQVLTAERNTIAASIPTVGNLNWFRLFLAGVLYGLGLVANAFVFREALMTFGHRIGMPTAIGAQLLGHLGKYIPGKAMVVVLRAGVVHGRGIPLMPATISVFMETLMMMGVGATVAGLLVLWLPVPAWMMWTAVAMAIGASLPTLPPILRRVAMKVTPNRPGVDSEAAVENHGETAEIFAEPPAPVTGATRFFLVGWLWTLISWAGIGLGFTLMVSAIPSGVVSPDWPLLAAASTAAISLAIVAGFISLLPGGAGIRELVLTTMLTPVVGPVAALLSAIAARLLFIAVDIALAGAAWWILRRRGGRLDGAE